MYCQKYQRSLFIQKQLSHFHGNKKGCHGNLLLFTTMSKNFDDKLCLTDKFH